MAKQSPPDPFVVDFDNVAVAHVDFYTSIQDRLEWFGEGFSTFAQALWGKKGANFLDSTPGHDQMDASWAPVRVLGKGGFGLVGLWRKTNTQNEVQDEIAIKEMQRPPLGNYHLDRNRYVAKEAAIMQQLNDAEKAVELSVKNILRLRSFKFFPTSERWRFYLEFAPYGDANKLIYSYRAWNAYLPEEFLWHVFYGLARALTIMEQGPFTHLETQEPTDWSVVHLDIKPDNIYLGKPHPTELFWNYPTIKVADFGLAELTGEDDEDNPARYRGKGTEDYMPPEQTCFTTHWHRRPDGVQHNVARLAPEACKDRESRMADPGYRFLSGHNVWACGKLMHDLLTLAYPAVLDQQMKEFVKEAEYYGRYDQNGIPPITTNKEPEYSLLLRDLIRECLHIEIGKRPTPRQLEERTYDGLWAATRLTEESMGELGGPRVYYMGHEINHMPAGNAGLPMRRHYFKGMRKFEWPDPAWQPLLSGRWAPEVKNGDLVNQPIEEGGPKRTLPQLFATVRSHWQPLAPNNRVEWKLRSPTETDDQASSGDENHDDSEDERRYQAEIAQKIRNSGTHDTQEHTSGPNEGNATDRRHSLERLHTRQRDAFEHLAREALKIPHPPAVPTVPTRLRLNGPKAPPDQQRPPAKRRRRVLGLSIDGSFQEAEGQMVERHNLRKRRR